MANNTVHLARKSHTTWLGTFHFTLSPKLRVLKVAKVLREAVLIARELGPTYIHLYTPCILEIGLQAHEGLWEMKEQDKDRFDSFRYVSPEAEVYLKECKEKGIL